MSFFDWLVELDARMYLGDLKYVRKQLEPKNLDNYFWFCYGNQGLEGPMFEHYAEVYSRGINKLENTLTKAQQVLNQLEVRGHKQPRIEALRAQLDQYQQHVETFPTAASYLSHLEQHLDAGDLAYVAKGHKQRTLDEMLG